MGGRKKKCCLFTNLIIISASDGIRFKCTEGGGGDVRDVAYRIVGFIIILCASLRDTSRPCDTHPAVRLRTVTRISPFFFFLFGKKVSPSLTPSCPFIQLFHPLLLPPPPPVSIHQKKWTVRQTSVPIYLPFY